ncbi:MAG TPA: hypothetical protein VNB49_15835 [Candidatus Dormibacteraeota bacterium]|nr:hypothetical protein [Candidatus Dormibacteraeota bacterium]
MATKIFAFRTIGAESAVSVANKILAVARTIAEAENVEVEMIGEVAATIANSRRVKNKPSIIIRKVRIADDISGKYLLDLGEKNGQHRDENAVNSDEESKETKES